MFELRIKGERRLYAALDLLSETAADVRELPGGWQPFIDTRLDFQRRHLDSEGAGAWQPLSQGYARWKESKVGLMPMLQFSTRMYRSLTEEGAAGYVRDEGAQTLKVGTNDPKARRHHEGKGSLPKREVIVVTDAEGQEHGLTFRDSYGAVSRSLGFRVI